MTNNRADDPSPSHNSMPKGEVSNALRVLSYLPKGVDVIGVVPATALCATNGHGDGDNENTDYRDEYNFGH
jgi:hypothetical protein